MSFYCTGAIESKIDGCLQRNKTQEITLDNSNIAYCCRLLYFWRDDYTLEEEYSECIAVSQKEFEEIEDYVMTAKRYIKQKYNEGYGSYVSYLKVQCNGNFLTTSFLSLILLLLF